MQRVFETRKRDKREVWNKKMKRSEKIMILKELRDLICDNMRKYGELNKKRICILNEEMKTLRAKKNNKMNMSSEQFKRSLKYERDVYMGKLRDAYNKYLKRLQEERTKLYNEYLEERKKIYKEYVQRRIELQKERVLKRF